MQLNICIFTLDNDEQSRKHSIDSERQLLTLERTLHNRCGNLMDRMTATHQQATSEAPSSITRTPQLTLKLYTLKKKMPCIKGLCD